MSEGSAVRALAWSAAVAVGLLAWTWLLAWLQARRPAWLAGTRVTDLASLRAGIAGTEPVRAGTLASWLALVTVAAVLPAARGLLAADLDAGLLWLAVLVVPAVPGQGERERRLTAAGLVTLLLCVLPVAMRAASLDLADLAIAQQGGAGNWFLLRDPFLLLAALVYLLAAAVLWPAPASDRSAGVQFALDAALRGGLPLVLAHLFVVVFLGGWWAFTVVLDGAALVNTALKTLATVAVLLALRRRADRVDPEHLTWLLPVAGLVCAIGGAVWMTVTGAAW